MYKFRGKERELEDPDREKEDDYFPNVVKVGSRTLTSKLPASRAEVESTPEPEARGRWRAASGDDDVEVLRAARRRSVVGADPRDG